MFEIKRLSMTDLHTFVAFISVIDSLLRRKKERNYKNTKKATTQCRCFNFLI